MSSEDTKPVIGKLEPWNPLFRSKFRRFQTPTVGGLVYVSGMNIEFLAIHTTEPGKGLLREFMEEMKASYDHIRFWAIMNDTFSNILVHYGFISGSDIDEFGEITDCMDFF